jgi:hypothetical protein
LISSDDPGWPVNARLIALRSFVVQVIKVGPSGPDRSGAPNVRKKTVLAWVTGAVMVLGLGAVMPFAQAGTDTSGRASTPRAASDPPDATWTEHWDPHDKTLELVGYNSTAALYFDEGVDRAAVAWMLPYVSQAWRYATSTYATAGSTMREGLLYVVIHEVPGADDPLRGGHAATRYDADHDNRNVIDIGGTDWGTPQRELITHEIGHIVENAASGFHLSPAFDVWKDSKWCEFFILDVFTALGVTDELAKVATTFAETEDDFPGPKSFWFRDFFRPLWKTYGKGAVMARYFKILGENFPRDGERLSGDLTLGGFIAYLSKAAGADLRPLATTAFGWGDQNEADFARAREEHPALVF